MLGSRTLAAGVAAAALLLPAGALPHAVGSVFAGLGTPTVDGVLEPGEWAAASALAFHAAEPGGATVPGELRVMNDGANLYLAVRLETSSPRTAVAFSFDNDHDGVWPEEGDDGLALGFGVRNGFGDVVTGGRGGCPAGLLCGFHDVDLGGTEDGRGLRSVRDGETQIEISHPLDSADDPNDFSLRAGDVVGFGFQVVICAESPECAVTQPVPFQPMGDIRIVEPASPAALLAELATAVETLGPGRSLAAKVRAAQDALARGDARAVAAILDAFVAEVRAQAGRSIPAATAQELAESAARIATALDR